METEEYKSMFELEETHWWYKGLRDLLFSTIRGMFGERQKIDILDAGCGTGFTLKNLDKYGTSFGIDISEVALEYCGRRNLNRTAKASVSRLPFRDNSFDLIVSLDVLYHKAVDEDTRAINEIYRVLKKEGILFINLPAHNYLKRRHDEKVHTRHRYAKNELRGKLQNNKFEIIKISYHNAFLFVILLLGKLVKKDNRAKGYSDLKAVWSPLNSLLHGFLVIENTLLKWVDIPFGTSIFCISKKT